MSKFFRGQRGNATVLVLGITLMISTILLIYSLWVRWDAFTTRSFMEETELKHRARAGINEGIMLLLADQEPEVDWLQEAWGKGISGNDYTVVISDIGSLFGFNWMSLEQWQAFLSFWDAERVYNYVHQQPVLVSDIELKKQFPIVGENNLPVTMYSVFNLNYVDEKALHALWESAGSSNSQAKELAQAIVSQRIDGDLFSDDLLHSSLFSTELFDKAEWWLAYEGSININTAPVDVLEVILSSESDAAKIAMYRESRGFKNLTELEQVLDMELLDLRLITFHSRFFQITSNVCGYQVEAVVARKWDQTSQKWELEILAWTEVDSGA